ncbi:helix-turn-helix domain-containing protein [Streptomyces sp. NPDC102383]
MESILGDSAATPEPDDNASRCRRCQCRLSRYNGETVCAGCSRSSTSAQPEQLVVPSQVWEHEEVKAALLERDFGRLCRLVRDRGDLRQEDMARMTRLSQPFLSMLESGRRRLTNIDRIIVLLDGLGTPLDLRGPMLQPVQAAAASHLRAAS